MSTNPTRSGQRGHSFAPSKKGKGRKPVAPVRVGKDRNWGPIIMFVVVGLIAAGIIGWATWAVLQEDTRPWPEQAAGIEGIVNFNETSPEMLEPQHQSGPLSYPVQPPVGGIHNDRWQNCEGNVYDAPIANEHAVHSMEHGTVWITYRPDLPADQVNRLAGYVRGGDFIMLSPHEGLDAPISLQAWGYQLKIDNADDGRIVEFIRALRGNAGPEAGRATCGSGVTTTGTVPIG
jgi:hypothetical protein